MVGYAHNRCSRGRVDGWEPSLVGNLLRWGTYIKCILNVYYYTLLCHYRYAVSSTLSVTWNLILFFPVSRGGGFHDGDGMGCGYSTVEWQKGQEMVRPSVRPFVRSFFFFFINFIIFARRVVVSKGLVRKGRKEGRKEGRSSGRRERKEKRKKKKEKGRKKRKRKRVFG